jgi:hypothetical protein
MIRILVADRVTLCERRMMCRCKVPQVTLNLAGDRMFCDAAAFWA